MKAAELQLTMTYKRAAGIAAGWSTQLLFGITVWYLYWFLQDGKQTTRNTSLLWDAFLALQFAIPHSILLLPVVKKRLTKFILPAFYGLMFCAVTCFSLLLLIYCWQTHRYELWHFQGAGGILMRICFIASWFALYYSINLTGLGYQTGYTPWSYWLRGEVVPPRPFQPRGAYHMLRHPVYLSFLGLIWFTPRMTLDHALLTAIWTAYIFMGSWLKDRRLTYYLGRTYQDYAAKVPGYTSFPFKGFFVKHVKASIFRANHEPTLSSPFK